MVWCESGWDWIEPDLLEIRHRVCFFSFLDSLPPIVIIYTPSKICIARDLEHLRMCLSVRENIMGVEDYI